MEIFCFFDFCLDVGRFELCKGETSIMLPRVPMEILILLVRRRGQLLTRNEIAAEIWPDADPEDVFANINVAVNRVRSALQDDASQPIYIQTVIGKGYRFIAPISDRKASQSSEQQVITENLSPTAPANLIPHSVGKKFRALQIAGLAAVITPVAVFAFLLLHSRYNRIATQRSTTSFRRLTNFNAENAVIAASISPDGRKLAYWDADGLMIRDFHGSEASLGDGQPLRAPALRSVDRIEWFADGASLLVSGWNRGTGLPEVWTVPLAERDPILFREGATQGIPSPDGSQVAYLSMQDTQVWVANRAGGMGKVVLSAAPDESFPVLNWASDGTKLLLAKRRAESSSQVSTALFRDNLRYTYLAVRVSNGQVTASQDGIRFNHLCVLAGNRLLMTTPEWLDDGVTSSVWVVDMDAVSGALRSTPRQVAWLWNYRTLALSSSQTTGQIVALLRIGLPAVYYANLEDHFTHLSETKRLNASMESAYPHGWSHDLRSVFYEGKPAQNWRIYRQNLDRHTPQTLADLPGQSAFPRPSSDGKWVLFMNRPNPASQFTLYRVPAEGGPSVVVPVGGAVQDFRCPSRTVWCVLREAQGTEFTYSLLDPVRGKGVTLLRVPKPEDFSAAWDVSPDGSHLAYVASRAPGARLRIVPLGSGSIDSRMHEVTVQTTTNISALSWDMDGTGWFVAVETAVGSNLLHCAPDGRTALLFSSPSLTYGVPSPDGKRIAFVSQYIDSNLWQVDVP